MRTNEEKVKKYECLLHTINLYRMCLNKHGVVKLLDNIDVWSYAHRSGNGISEEEQQERIDQAFDKLDRIKE